MIVVVDDDDTMMMMMTRSFSLCDANTKKIALVGESKWSLLTRVFFARGIFPRKILQQFQYFTPNRQSRKNNLFHHGGV